MTILNGVALTIAIFALVISAFNFWLTHLRRGRLLLSQPMMFFFGWDNKDEDDSPKIMFRAALFSTAAKGHVLENLYLVLHHPDGVTILPFWGYDSGAGLVRGSGVHIPQTGLVAYHHFNPLGKEDSLSFSPGHYRIEVRCKNYSSKKDEKIGEYTFELPKGILASDLRHHESGVLWSWLPSNRRYFPEASPRKNKHNLS